MPEYHGAGQALRIDTVEAVDVLAWHAAAWDWLALAAPERLPMLSYAWVKSFLEHRLDPGESWRCLFAYTGDELVGVLPLIRSKHLVGGTQLRGPSDPHTTRSGHALLAVGREREVLSALLKALRDLEPDPLWVKFSGVRDLLSDLASQQSGYPPRACDQHHR